MLENPRVEHALDALALSVAFGKFGTGTIRRKDAEIISGKLHEKYSSFYKGQYILKNIPGDGGY